MSDVSKLRIDPARAVEGDVVRLVLERPLSSAGLPSVRVGELPADALVVCTPELLLSRIPEGPTGTREVTVHVGEGREIEARGSLEQVGAAERTPQAVTTRLGEGRAAETKKTGDPTSPSSAWWMIHQALAHNSCAQDGNVVPLKPLWTRTFSGASMLTQPVLGDAHVLVGIYGNGAEHFAALDPQTGSVVWSRTGTQVSVLGTPVAVNGRVYLIEWTPAWPDPRVCHDCVPYLHTRAPLPEGDVEGSHPVSRSTNGRK